MKQVNLGFYRMVLFLLLGLFTSVIAYSQQISVKGIVKDQIGEPVIGANVLVRGTTNGVITNVNGEFILSASKSDVLVVSFVGYTTQEIPVSEKQMTIVLKEDTELLDEVVVLGYGANTRKQDLSASVGIISNTDELAARPVTSTESMLQGQLPGVTIQADGGDPTSTPNIVIRGQGSQNGDDVQPEGDARDNAYFLNDQQAIDAVDGLYERFHQEAMYGRELFWEQGAANDIVWGKTRDFPTLATFKYTGDESPLRTVFETMYKVISRSNWVIDQLVDKEKTTALTEIENRSLGEAYFTRGWAHFLMAYRYGTDKQGVPFVRYEDFVNGYDNSIPPQQASVIDNYKLIIEDMENAKKRLPRFEDYDDKDLGRAHQAAAIAFQVKVYAYWAMWDETKWDEVIKLVDELETTYNRGLADTFDELFSSDFSKYWGKEYLWTIPGTGGSTGGGSEFPGVILENKGWGIYNGWGQIKPTYDIYAEMLKDGDGKENDRLKRSILEYGQKFLFFGEEREFYSASDIESGFQINKYMEPFGYANATTEGYVNANGDWPTARVNFPIIRFAEMMLFRAEAYLMKNQPDKAWKDLNRIHVRACGLSLPSPATMEQLYHERRCELAFEFTDHLFDLKRWHHSSNAEIKALAEKELNARPLVRHYKNRGMVDTNGDGKPDAIDYTHKVEFYTDYTDKTSYKDCFIVFPYPSNQIINSNGQLKQNIYE